MLQVLTVFILAFSNWTALAQSPGVVDEKNPLTAQVQLTPFEVGSGQIAQIEAKISLPAGYRAYEDQFKVEIKNPPGFKIASFSVSPTKEIYDKFTKKTKKFVTDAAIIKAPIEIAEGLSAGDQKFILSITYRACTDTFCLFPKTTDIDVHFKILNNAAGTEDSGFLQQSFKDIYQKGLFWTFLFVFVFGFLTSFTPCVYPMIPITLAILGREAHARSRLQTFLVSVSYVAGIALTFSALGVFAASTGVLFGSFMSSPWILGFICLVFFAMALSMLGFFELQAPQFLRDGILSHLKLHGYVGAFISGLLAGVVASPCVGPVLVGVLTFVAQTKSVWLGFWLLFTYAVGMGLIFLALGLSTSMTRLLPKSGGWTNKIKIFFAVLMFGASLYYLDQLLLTSRITQKSYFSVSTFKSATDSKTGFALDLIDWQKYSETILAEAAQAQKPVVIDFRADWCAACLEMEEKTFTVQSLQLLAKRFVMIKFDATNESPELAALREKFKIVGLPTFLFFSSDGKWLEKLTLTEFEAAGPFEERMKKALQAENPQK